MKLNSLPLKQYASTRFGRMGMISTFSVAVMLTLAACGTPSTPVQQPTATTQGQAAATVTSTLEAPPAVSTESTDTPIDRTETIPDAVATGTAGAMEMTGGSVPITPTAVGPSDTATPSPAGQSGQTIEAVTEIKGTLREWSIDLSQKEATAGTIRFVVTNEGQFTHDFTITGSNGEIAATPGFTAADGPQLVEIDLEPGTYTLICNLPGHAVRGQKTELVVK